MKRARPYDVLLLVLLVAGWIFPSIQPPYGVALASTGLRNPEHYWISVCAGNLGYFSGSVLVLETWEQGSHGLSYPIGPCIPANVLSALVPLSAALMIFSVRSKKFLLSLWEWIIVALALMGAFFSYTSWQFPRESVILAFIFVGFETYLAILKLLAKKRERDRVDVLSRNILCFYPIWILVLALTQQVFPFVGWLLTTIGCVLLAVRKNDPASSEMSAIVSQTA